MNNADRKIKIRFKNYSDLYIKCQRIIQVMDVNQGYVKAALMAANVSFQELSPIGFAIDADTLCGKKIPTDPHMVELLLKSFDDESDSIN